MPERDRRTDREGERREADQHPAQSAHGSGIIAAYWRAPHEEQNPPRLPEKTRRILQDAAECVSGGPYERIWWTV